MATVKVIIDARGLVDEYRRTHDGIEPDVFARVTEAADGQFLAELQVRDPA